MTVISDYFRVTIKYTTRGNPHEYRTFECSAPSFKDCIGLLEDDIKKEGDSLLSMFCIRLGVQGINKYLTKGVDKYNIVCYND